MSTFNREKESLLGQMVLVKRSFSNFDRGHFFSITLYMFFVLTQSAIEFIKLIQVVELENFP